MTDPYDSLNDGTPDEPKPVEVDYSIPGDLVLFFGEECESRVVIRTTKEKEEWISAMNSDPWQDLPKRAPTAVDFRGSLYQISRISKHGSAIEYHLVPWPEYEILRRTVVYSREAVLRDIADQARAKRAHMIASIIKPLFPLIGLLPSDAQYAIAEHIPINVHATIGWSIVAEAFGSIAFMYICIVLNTVGSIVQGQSVSYLPDKILGIDQNVWLALCPFLLLDAVVRWRKLATRGEALGVLAFEGAFRLLFRNSNARRSD